VTKPPRHSLHLLLTALTFLLAAMLMLSALRTYQELSDQRVVYLRSRVATLAARLESIPPSVPQSEWQQLIAAEEDSLAALAILDRAGSDASLAPLWDGRELFRTESIFATPALFRAYVPFHSNGHLLLARIDIAADSADFLTAHAIHHLILVGAGGLLIVILSLVSLYGASRLAHAERRQVELQNLATLGEMSAALAHEIRNPLGTIKGFAQLLQEKLHGQHDSLLTPILSETSRLEALVRDLLLYGRPAQPVLGPVKSHFLEQLVRQHAPQAPRLDNSVAPFTLITDPNLLEQVLLNLLRNAFDAAGSQPDGFVRFEALATPHHAILRVVDNGPGLSEAASARLFEPFFTTKATGTGLGLSISRKLIEALGGSLTISSPPAGGLAAEIRLPLHPHA